MARARRRSRPSPLTSTAARRGPSRRSASTSSIGRAGGRPLPRCLLGSVVLELSLQRRRLQSRPPASGGGRRRAGGPGSRRRRQPSSRQRLPSAVWRNSLPLSTDGLLTHAVFTPSGTESVDLALRLSRAVTGRPRIVAALGGYHGAQRVRPGRQRPPLARALRVRAERFRTRPVQRHRGHSAGDRLRNRGGDHGDDPGDARLRPARSRLPAGGRRGRHGMPAPC